MNAADGEPPAGGHRPYEGQQHEVLTGFRHALGGAVIDPMRGSNAVWAAAASALISARSSTL